MKNIKRWNLFNENNENKLTFQLFYVEDTGDNIEGFDRTDLVYKTQHYNIYLQVWDEFVEIILTDNDGVIYDVDDLLNGLGYLLQEDDTKEFDSYIKNYKDIYAKTLEITDNKENSELYKKYLKKQKTKEFNL